MSRSPRRFANSIFTTGQVAKICKVAPRTVSKWFDSGRLKGHRIPGSQDRRIPREYLIKFLKEHGMIVPPDLEDETIVIVISNDSDLAQNLKQALDKFKIISVSEFFDAGMATEEYKPAVVIVDFDTDKHIACRFCANARKNEKLYDTIIIALLSDTGKVPHFDRSKINETFKKPFDLELLAERIKTLYEAQQETLA